MDIHLISTFTRLQLFICQIHHLHAKWTFVISSGAHGDSTLKEARKKKKSYLTRIIRYKNVHFQNIINLNNGITAMLPNDVGHTQCINHFIVKA
jgi:hypothetical protein